MQIKPANLLSTFALVRICGLVERPKWKTAERLCSWQHLSLLGTHCNDSGYRRDSGHRLAPWPSTGFYPASRPQAYYECVNLKPMVIFCQRLQRERERETANCLKSENYLQPVERKSNQSALPRQPTPNVGRYINYAPARTWGALTLGKFIENLLFFNIVNKDQNSSLPHNLVEQWFQSVICISAPGRAPHWPTKFSAWSSIRNWAALVWRPKSLLPGCTNSGHSRVGLLPNGLDRSLAKILLPTCSAVALL